ncbi:MAG: CDP-glycerol glycerophosphotransferase family protein, partial [Candidatus Cloacimonetes bacterium]|nr:CDP-glycerol glycerophosphotransferase family protein [Candidatus Cloacimonadota bacterium]
YPKSDSLFDGSYTPQMLSKLRQDLNLDPQKTILLFSSTWDGSQMSAIEKWYSKVDSITGDYNVLVTLHPRMSDFYKNYFKQQANLCYIEAMDIYPYLLLADVCIGDTNSLIAEFCIVDKPIITFSIPPTKRTLDDVIELIKGISIRIDSFAELPLAIDTAVKTAKETSPIRKAVISTLIDPLDGKAGCRAATEISNLMPELKI